MLINVIERTAGFSIKIAAQVAATDTDDPSSWEDFSSAITAQGKSTSAVFTMSTEITSYSSNFFVRFGLGVLSTASDKLIQRGIVAMSVVGRT